jgi:hypothetical protein
MMLRMLVAEPENGDREISILLLGFPYIYAYEPLGNPYLLYLFTGSH